jgi:hypothetical protein
MEDHMKASLGSLLNGHSSDRRKFPEATSGRLRGLIAIAAVTAAFGFPVWIIVTTIGNAPPQTQAAHAYRSPAKELPWQVVRSERPDAATMPEVIPARSARAASPDALTPETVSGTEVAPFVKGSRDKGASIITEIPSSDEAPTVISH